MFRLQEEQSQAFRSARRSRTVVKLLREAYRLGDVATGANDVGGPMLELLVENTLCDRAMLLREEPAGGGAFRVAHAVGLGKAPGGSVSIPAPPPFLYTTAAQGSPTGGANAVVAAVGVSFVLWAHDPGTGHALVVGNNAETSLSRPFEAADRELIEAALAIYLDVLYRKTAEAGLRQAKHVADVAEAARAAGLAALADGLRQPLGAVADLAATLRSRGNLARGPAQAGTGGRPGHSARADPAAEIVTLSRAMLALVARASEQLEALAAALSLDVEWVPVDDLVRPAIASTQAVRASLGVEVDATLPRRRTAVLVDRRRMQHVLQLLLAIVVRGAPAGGRLRVDANRRGDGGLEFVLGAADCPARGANAPPSRRPALDAPNGPDLAIPRAIAKAHGGTLAFEAGPLGRPVARVVLPAANTRDFELSGGPVSAGDGSI